MKILITSGGTRVPIDNVRSITNFSNGGFGRRLAIEFLLKNHHVTHLHSINAPTPFEFKVDLVNARGKDYSSELESLHCFSRKYMSKYSSFTFDTYTDYIISISGLSTAFKYDVILLCAAVSDFTVDVTEAKLSSDMNHSLSLTPTKKVIDIVRKNQPNTKLVGFKLLSNVLEEELFQASFNQINKSGSDIVIANRLEDIKGVNKTVFYIHGQNTCKLTGDTKTIAEKIVNMIGV